MTTTPTSGAADLPEELRSIQRFEVVDCIDDKHVPAVIPKPHGPWVRYADHVTALAAGQATAAPAQPAAQQGAAYAALPEPYCNAHDDADACYPDMFSEHQMRAFADATHTLRASHGQAPAQPAQRFGAADMATAAAQGFRDGVASVSAGSEPADTVVLNAAMRAIQQAIELIGAPTGVRMRAVRRVLRGAVIVAEDAGKVAPLPAAPGPADGESK